MPYELKFTKTRSYGDEDKYFNDCCFGGDIVVDLVLSSIQDRYSGIQSEQEDWGWFIWFENGDSKGAIDIFCDDPRSGQFTIHLHFRDIVRTYFVFTSEIENMDKLEGLREIVLETLHERLGVKVTAIYKSKLA